MSIERVMLKPGFLQTADWAKFQQSLGRQVFNYDQAGIAALVIKNKLPLGKSWLYIPRGPELDLNSMTGGLTNPVNNFIAWLRVLAKKEKAIFIKVEPTTDNVAQILATHKFRNSRRTVQPTKTVVLDLEKTEADLLAAMHHKARYNIRVAEKHGINVVESTAGDVFWKLMQQTTRRDKFTSHPKTYYRALLEQLHGGTMHTKLFIAQHQDRPLAAALVLFYGDTAYYLHGASDHHYRQLMAPYLLHWEIIKRSQALALKQYDLWGIDANKWPGVTRFKLGWGGKTIEYPGAFDLTTSWFWFSLYKLFK